MALLRWIEKLSMWIAGLALLVMGAIVTTSVIGRVVFNAPVPDDLIMVGLLMVCTILLPLAYIESQAGHIVVTIIADRFPKRLQAILRASGALAMGIFFGTIGVMVAGKVPQEFAEDLYYDGQLDIPTWPMKIVFAFGVAILVLRLAVTVFQSLRFALFGAAKTDTDTPSSSAE